MCTSVYKHVVERRENGRECRGSSRFNNLPKALISGNNVTAGGKVSNPIFLNAFSRSYEFACSTITYTNLKASMTYT